MAVPDQLSKGQTFTDGDTVNAATLNALVDQGTILQGSIMEQTALAGVADPTDQVLVYDASAAGLRRAAFSQFPASVTSVSAGNLAGVFTTSVASPTSTPALSFAMATASANKFLASPADGTLGALSMRKMAVGDLALAGVAIAATAIDWSLGNVFTKSMTGNHVFTFSNMLDGQIIRVRLLQNAAWTATWPGTVLWRGGTVPVVTAIVGRRDIFTFTYIGGVIYGYADQNFF
jgi:hypothetical protein